MRRHSTILWGLCALWLIFGHRSGGAEAAEPVSRILVLMSYDSEWPWSRRMLAGIRKGLTAAPRPVRIHVEWLDTKRYPGETIRAATQRLLLKKLNGQSFDVVMACDNHAFSFALDQRAALGGEAVPLVFCGVNNFRIEMLRGQANATGVAEVISFADTVKVALRIHATAKHVVLIGSTGTLSERINLQQLRQAIAPHQGRILVEEWLDPTTTKLRSALPALPADRVIFQSGVLVDPFGTLLSYQERAAFSRRYSRAPVYSFSEQTMGHGIVGGRLVSGHGQGQAAARRVVRILRGEAAETIPVAQEESNPYIFDWREMQRFGIDPAILPKQREVWFYPPSLLDRLLEHWREVLISLIASSLVFILWRHTSLVSLNRRLSDEIIERKRTEAALSESRERTAMLLREVNHRVKNNLTALLSLVHIEHERLEEDSSRPGTDALADLESRIQGLATVHGMLSSGNWRPVRLTDLIRRLGQHLVRDSRIDLEVSESPITVDSVQAHHLTLIINELFTNSAKYARTPSWKLVLTVELSAMDDTVRLVFCDNGPGFSGALLKGGTDRLGVGIALVRGITKGSLQGTFEVGNAPEGGARIALTFPRRLTTEEESREGMGHEAL